MTAEKTIIPGLQDRDVRAFKALVYDYSDEMIDFAYLLLNDRIRAAIVVDSVLLAIRAADESFKPSSSLRHYLLAQVCKACGLPYNNPPASVVNINP